MADRKVAYASPVSLTLTNLNSNTSSNTNAWESGVIDNTSNKYLDALVLVTLDFANTSPANDRVAYVYAYGGLESGGPYTNTNNGVIDGTESDETFLNVTTTPLNLPLVGVVNYVVADEVATAGPWSIARLFGGWLPPYWGLTVVNYTGASLAASGNVIKYMGVYETLT